MSVNTNANIPTGVPNNTKINTGGGSLKYMTVEIEGQRLPVQTRYDSTTGETAAVVIVEKQVTTQVNTRGSQSQPVTRTVEEPVVLFTIDDEGTRTLGGSGVSDVKNQLGGGSQITTTEAEATTFIGTLEIDGSSATQDELFAEHDVRADALHSSTKRDIRKGAASTTVQGVTPIEATAGAGFEESIPPVDPDKEAEVDPDEGKEPEPSNPLNAVGDIFNDIKKVVVDIAEDFKISEEDLKAFEESLASGAGDLIQSAAYPFDNTYGAAFGQDYVTIDQFEYQAPRRDQIFGEDPLKNISEGNIRITPLKKFIAQVKLPMPNSINDANQVSWGQDAMNNITAALVSGTLRNPGAVAAGAIGGGLVGGLLNMDGLATLGAMAGVGYNVTDSSNSNVIENLKERFAQIQKATNTQGGQMATKTAIGSAILGMAGVNVSPESILSRGLGVIPNANLELLFDTPKLRTFEFSWKLSPRDENEAKEVKKIIRFFKQGMAARTISNQAGDRALFLGTPNIFRIQYRTAGGEIIEGVNRIKPCAVTGTAVNYTPDGVWSAYDKGQPVSTVFTISMSELEPVYASDYTQDNITNERRSNDITEVGQGDGDLYSIRPSEVGY